MTNSSQSKDQRWVGYYLPLAESGDPKAQIAVGWEYHRGKIFEKSILEAEKWFRKAEKTVGEIGIFQLMKMLHIENDRRMEDVFREKDDWSLGAIYMVYGCDLIDRGNLADGLQMLSVAERKGNIYARTRADQVRYRGFARLLAYPSVIATFFRWLKIKLKNPDDERALT